MNKTFDLNAPVSDDENGPTINLDLNMGISDDKKSTINKRPIEETSVTAEKKSEYK